MATARPRFKRALLHCTVLAALWPVCVAGCIGADEDSEATDVDVEQSELGISCHLVQADRTFTGKIDPAHVSPRTYGPFQGAETCFETYVVDVLNLQTAYTGQGTTSDANIAVKWADSLPAFPISRTTCESLRSEAALFLRQGTSWVKQGTTKVSTGTWATVGGVSFCRTPAHQFLGTQPGKSYRIAANARQGGTLGALRSISVKTNKPTN